MESIISTLHFCQSEYIDMELFLLGEKSRRLSFRRHKLFKPMKIVSFG